jgi:di/tricarboxylate transporter
VPFDLTGQQATVFVILIVAFALLLTERLRPDLVAVLIVLSLWATRVLTSDQALSGFSSEPAIVVAGIFVVTGALSQTGLSEIVGGWVSRAAGKGLSRAIVVIMTSVELLSAFTHHVTTTAAFVPITMKLSEERDIPPSKLLMPLSFAASLGTTITIIGAPAFLIASGVLKQGGASGLGVFSIAPIGLALSAAGTLFMVVCGRFLLPARRGTEDTTARYRLEDYFTEVKVLEGSPLEGKTVAEVEADDHLQFRVVGWVRNGRRMPRPYGDRPLGTGDVLLVRASPEQILAFRQERGNELHPVAQYGEQGSDDTDDLADRLVQAVIAPGSDFIGRNLSQLDFHGRYGAIVLALWRQRGWIQQEMSRVRLQPGDVLVLQGDEDALGRVAQDRAFQMLTPFQGEPRARRKAPIAAAVMLATVVLAAFTEIQMAALAGAAAMVLTGCITPRQAYRSIDTRIFVFIAGAIPLGTAMEKSKASDKLAHGLQQVIGGWSPFLVLLAIFAVVAVLTQFMSDSATTAIFGPVALALAQAVGRRPEPFVVTVAMASVAAFLTPIGHHGNLLIYSPGGYRFADFVRVGAPLTVLAGVIVALMAPLVWR